MNRPRALETALPSADPWFRLRHSVFGQACAALHLYSGPNLRMAYAHPMDDGQRRAFRVRFEGEGVDDYGGPYREVFSHIAAELQQLPVPPARGAPAADSAAACALPLLLPSPNAAGAGGEERGLRVLHPAPLGSTWRQLWGAAELRAAEAAWGAPDAAAAAAGLPPVGSPSAEVVLHPTLETHFAFAGQLLGVAVRSHVHIGLALPPTVWRGLAGEPLIQQQGQGQQQADTGDLESQVRLVDSAAVAALAYGLSAAVAWALEALGGGACVCGACATALAAAEAAATTLQLLVSGSAPSCLSAPARAAAVALLPLLDTARPPCACAGVAAAAAAACHTPAPGLEDSTWTVSLSSGDVVALFPGPRPPPAGAADASTSAAPAVTVLDWLDGAYARAVLDARVREAAPALAALRRGLLSVLPAAALPLLGAAGLRAAVCGADDVDVDLLAANTELEEGLSPDAPHVLGLWRVLRSFDAAQRRAFLRFVWARSALPAAAADFTQKFKLQTMTLGGGGGALAGGAPAEGTSAGDAPPPAAPAAVAAMAAAAVVTATASTPSLTAPPAAAASGAPASAAPAPLSSRGPASLPSEDLMLLSAAGRRAAQLAQAAGAATGRPGSGASRGGARPGSGAPPDTGAAGGATPRASWGLAGVAGASDAPAASAAARPGTATRERPVSAAMLSARSGSTASLRPPLHAPQQLAGNAAPSSSTSSAPPAAAAIDGWLPTAHTCFFSLHLPRYSSDAVLRRQLLYAVTHCLALDADFRLTEAEAGATWGL